MGTSDRRPYLTATVLDQALLDQMADNLDFQLVMIADITGPDGEIIRASDRNGYVGTRFYRAITQFPVLKRVIGQWLNPTVEFSTLSIAISNVLGEYNHYLPGGADFDGWIGRSIVIKQGLRDVLASFQAVFRGRVTDIGGVGRERDRITFSARDILDHQNPKFPKTVLTVAEFMFLEESRVGTIVPVVYGDWTTGLPKETFEDPIGEVSLAIVPAIPTNGANAGVIAGTTDLELIVSENNNVSLDNATVVLRRGEQFSIFDIGDVTVGAGNRFLTIKQGGSGGSSTVVPDLAPYTYASGDLFFVQVKGKDLGAYSDNPVAQAKDILETQGGFVDADFKISWATYADKATPPQSNIAANPSRVWVQDQEEVVAYAQSLLSQVRLQFFEDRDLKLNIRSLHFEDFVSSPTFKVKNWDIVEGSLEPRLDDQNIWNRARADFGFNPRTKQQGFATRHFKNQVAIDQAGKQISKLLIFPNLYDLGNVELQVTEMIRLASSYPEMVDVVLTPRASLLDLGGFVQFDVDMGATVLSGVPMMIREIGADPKGNSVPAKFWSMQMTKFPGYTPSGTGAVGGYDAVIIAEP